MPIRINMNVNLGLINPALSLKATHNILISVVGCHYFGWYPTNSSTRFCWFEIAMAVHGSTIQLRMLTGWICHFGDLVVWECIYAMLLPQYSNMEVSINVVSPNGWFIIENPMNIDDLGVPPILGNLHIPILNIYIDWPCCYKQATSRTGIKINVGNPML